MALVNNTSGLIKLDLNYQVNETRGWCRHFQQYVLFRQL